jgi:hypothetical protein
MFICVCLCILASSRIPRYDLGRQPPHFRAGSVIATSDEQYESIPNDKITLLARKFCTLYKFRKERRRSPRGRFECGDTTHFITNCPKRKKLDSSNKYNYNNRNDSSDKGEGKKKYRFGDKRKKF